MNNEAERKFSWNDLSEIWTMAYKEGYENGYMNGSEGYDYNSMAYAHPPEVLRKIFESSEEEE